MFKKCLALLAVIACLTSSEAADVQIGGKTLSEIPNIIKAVTGQATFQVGKKSLMFLETASLIERGHNEPYLTNSDTSYQQARIFQFKEDGSVEKEFVFDPVRDTGSLRLLSQEYNSKKVQPAVANKASKAGLAVKYDSGSRVSGYDNYSAVQTFTSSAANNQLSVSAQTLSKVSNGGNGESFYGNGALTLPTYYGEVFASASSYHKSELRAGNPVVLKLSFFKYNQEGNLEHDTEKELTLYTVTEYQGLYHASMAAGDFDNDGYKNDVALLVFTQSKATLYFYTVTYDRTNGKAELVQRLTYDNRPRSSRDPKPTPQHGIVVHDWQGYWNFDKTFDTAANGNVFCGDFDGDGNIEVAASYMEPHGASNSWNGYQAEVYEWNSESNVFERMQHRYSFGDSYQGLIGVHGVAADLNGDGADEIVLVGFGNWYDNSTTEANIRPFIYIKDVKNDSRFLCNVIHENDSPSFYLSKNGLSFFPDEAFSIAAGPFRGKFGKTKTVDDLAFSFTNDKKQVFLIPSPVDDKGDWVNTEPLGTYLRSWYGRMPFTKIYESDSMPSSLSGSYYGADFFRGGLAAADFLGEGIELSDPEKLTDAHDSNYIAIIPAFPYHVDNLTADGTALTDYPTNFSFSGFRDVTAGGGEMYVTYNASQTSQESRTVKFSSTGTIDKFFATAGDDSVSQLINTKFQYYRMTSSLFKDASAGTKYGSYAAGAQKFFDFFNEHTEAVNDKINESAATVTMEDSIMATANDAVLMFDTVTHIWRYKVLANYLPAWLVPGQTINESPVPDANNAGEYYISFSVADAPTKTTRTNTYQPRHEEGNLFSYPAAIDQYNVEGYTPDGKLGDKMEFKVPSLAQTASSITFKNASTVKDQATQTVTPSEATKTGTFFKNAWTSIKNFFTGSNEKTQATPAKTEHAQTFTKNYATDEKISFIASHRTTLVNHAVGYTVNFIPYKAKEGTMRVAEAVQLTTSPSENYALFSPIGSSLYRKYPDPALILPNKFRVCGSNFLAQDNNVYAMNMRGVRFYSKNYDGYSDRVLIPGLTYIIEVPVYNASFVTPSRDVAVRLSYSNTLNPTVKNDPSRTVIGTQTIKLRGWDNQVNDIKDGTSNRGVVNFEWTIPDSVADGNYYLYAEIDPDNALQEVHESRMAPDGKTVRDVGGNNEGHFAFAVLHVNDANMKRILANGSDSIVDASSKVLYASSITKPAGGFRAADTQIDPFVFAVNGFFQVNLNGSQDISPVIEMLRQAKISSPDDPVVIECEVTNMSSIGEIYPHVIFYGFNFNPNAEGSPLILPEDIDGDTILNYEYLDHAFVRYDISLFPNETLKFVFKIIPDELDFENGFGFVLFSDNSHLSSSYSNTYPDPVIDTTDPEDGSDTGTEDTGDVSALGSSGGGCDAGFGSLVLMVFAGMGLCLRKK